MTETITRKNFIAMLNSQLAAFPECDGITVRDWHPGGEARLGRASNEPLELSKATQDNCTRIIAQLVKELSGRYDVG